MGLSRNKVAVPEGAAGTPPFWSGRPSLVKGKKRQNKGFSTPVFLTNKFIYNGGLAQLARALAWHARGHRFDSDILHLRPNPFPDGRQNAH